jgi:hypothetical protein
MIDNQNDRIIFSITAEQLQNEAVKRIGRKLTDNELQTAVKGVESGLSTGLDEILKTAIDEAVAKQWRSSELTRSARS